MKGRGLIARAALTALAVLAGGSLSLAASPPAGGGQLALARVEPPSWWVGHSINPVRLLLHGSGLAGASLSVVGRGLTLGAPTVSASGTWLFVDATIDPSVAPGPRAIEARKGALVARLRFDLLAPPPREGRFQGLSRDDVVYLVLPDRFADGDPTNDDPPKSPGLFNRTNPRFYHGGDLQGVIDHLGYIRDLGATTVWLTPVYDNVDRVNTKEHPETGGITDYHGYGAVDFYGVEEHLGTLEKYRELVDRAHALGLKVMQDQVANHTGPYHPWVEDPPTPTWFNGTLPHHLTNAWQAWTLADPHATPDTRRTTLDGWFLGLLPDLDQDDPEVARYLIQNSLWWVGQTGVDAIRQDTLPYVPRAYWREWTEALAREYPTLGVLGELWDGDPALVAYFQKGATGLDGIDTGIESLFDYPLFYAIRRAFAGGQPLSEVPQALAHDRLYPAPGRLVPFLGLHDVPRFLSEPGATVERLKQAFTFLFTTRGIPLVYYGDEVAMTGGGDPDNRRDFPGGFPADPVDDFSPAGRSGEAAAVHDHVARLARLRAELAPLRRGRLLNLQIADQAWAFARREGEASVVVAINEGAEPFAFDLDGQAAGLPEGTAVVDRLGETGGGRVEGGRLRVTVDPSATAVFVPEPR